MKRIILIAILALSCIVTIQAQTIQKVTVSLSQSQIDSLASTPVELVPAQGVGNVIIPISIVVDYSYGGIPYSGNSLFFLNGGEVFAIGYDRINYGSSYIVGIGFGGINVVAGYSTLMTLTDNGNLTVTTPTAPAYGNGTMNITVQYIVSTH